VAVPRHPGAQRRPQHPPAQPSGLLDPAAGRKEPAGAVGSGTAAPPSHIPPVCISSRSGSQVPRSDTDPRVCWEGENPLSSQKGSNSASFGENSHETLSPPCNTEPKSQNEKNCDYSYIADKKLENVAAEKQLWHSPAAAKVSQPLVKTGDRP